MTTAITNRLYTEQEYLKMEEKSPVRHEFINGKIYEMSGGSMLHEKIIMNLAFLLRIGGLEVFAQGLRVRPPASADYYYPDVLVTAEKVARVYYAEAPLLIAEVLSPSTRIFNIVDKFIAYRQFPSLHYYLLAEPDFCQVTLFYKGEAGEWESEVFHQLTAVISLEKLGVQLRVSEIYSGMEWAEEA